MASRLVGRGRQHTAVYDAGGVILEVDIPVGMIVNVAALSYDLCAVQDLRHRPPGVSLNDLGLQFT